ncbi:transglutaminase-like domain-containing protein [Chitinophagaceae bacterium LB-8]|uniref:Transglutaminase-like domain-containing protein n=1 Tax=Paraflavisolibacter caeni TaxID=2982496 RepID=A0A9X3B6H9_9BACT|nr:transglutaminase domain-containing protein [Paraflavisolibacter caeni]MCU7548060.1 transglutaminase-like domain-containing protein [Paraflavisolibacter caeni]
MPYDSTGSNKWKEFYENLDKKEIKEADNILQKNTEIKKKTSTIEKVLTIGNFIYNEFHAQTGMPTKNSLYLSAIPLYRFLKQNRKEELWCGQYASMMLTFCWSQNIATRYIEIFHPGNHHTINECFIPELGKWVMVDITNNILISETRQNGYLNFVDFHNKVNSFQEISLVSSTNNKIGKSLLDKNNSFVTTYFKDNDQYYFYHHINLKKAYKSTEKIKRYFFPMYWYEIFSENQSTNLLFFVKLIFVFAWLLSLIYLLKTLFYI